MTRLLTLLVLFFGLWPLPSAGADLSAEAPAKVERRPNILVILADDLGYSDLGCYGGEVPTPSIDRLAKGGVRFSAFYNSARCCPSRASLMTGLHPHEAGIGSFAQARPTKGWGAAYTGHLLRDTTTLAEILGDAGYSTWMVGKWHMGIPGPIERGFQNYYGFKNFLAHSENQWDPEKYARLPEGTEPELSSPKAEFYVTDVFTDYALEFLRQARAENSKPKAPGSRAKPWFLYLAHSSPHFPIQAPRESIDRHVDTYRRGWDVLRAERFERQKKLGLVPADASLPPLSEVPVDRDDIANGYPGKPNPSWNSLPADRREDLARRGATFAAMVEHVDRGIGRIIADLEKHGELENTLVFFTSDNGACYEWGPFGFDGPSRKGTTTLHRGAELERIGQDGTHQSYGSGWANLGNTPLNMYKHFCHEGGITSPLIVHWPAGLEARAGFIGDPAHIMDIVPTVCEATGVPYPETRGEIDIRPLSGTSLLPACRGESLPERALAFEHQKARGLRKGDWKLVWGKRQPDPVRWELYNLKRDRSEQHDLAAEEPEKLQELILEWTMWARRVGAEPFQHRDDGTAEAPGGGENPPVANTPLGVFCEFEAGGDNDGVLLAHGGVEQGYALHLVAGKPAFDVRVNGVVTRVLSGKRVSGRTKLTATLDKKAMTLSVNGEEVASKPSPGLIPVQPKDDLSVGRDILSAAGDYDSPNPFGGTIHDFKVTTGSGTIPASSWKTTPNALPKPLFADPHYHGSCDPEIVWNPAANEWFVYYTARRATRPKASYVGTPIGVISSPDLRTWTFRGYCSFDGRKGQPDNDDTHWAPGIIAEGDTLHMFATYKQTADPPWGGDGEIRHYTAPLTDPVDGWKLQGVPSFNQPDPIDVSLLAIDGGFRAYYRVGKGGGIQWAESRDLVAWKNHGKCPGDVNADSRGFDYQEAPYVFRFGGSYWMITDPHKGLAIFKSPDAITWKLQDRILEQPGIGPQDATPARHPSVAVIEDRAFLFYHVEPRRPYPTPPPEKRTVKQKISFLQVAELKVADGRLTCDRNAPVEL